MGHRALALPEPRPKASKLQDHVLPYLVPSGLHWRALREARDIPAAAAVRTGIYCFRRRSLSGSSPPPSCNNSGLASPDTGCDVFHTFMTFARLPGLRSERKKLRVQDPDVQLSRADGNLRCAFPSAMSCVAPISPTYHATQTIDLERALPLSFPLHVTNERVLAWHPE